MDSEKLSPDESAELNNLVNAAGIFDLPAPDGQPSGADQFQYNLTIETPERQRTVELRDPTSPDVKRLLDWVWSHARPG